MAYKTKADEQLEAERNAERIKDHKQLEYVEAKVSQLQAEVDSWAPANPADSSERQSRDKIVTALRGAKAERQTLLERLGR